MKEFRYYYRDAENNPVITVYLLLQNDGNFGRGMAICSDSETPVKNVRKAMRNGPGIAKKRALEAMKAKASLHPICREEAMRVVARVQKSNPLLYSLLSVMQYKKATYNGRVTAFETKLLVKAGAFLGLQCHTPSLIAGPSISAGRLDRMPPSERV